MILGLRKQGFFLDRKGAKKKLGELAEKYGLSVDPEATISELSVRTAAKSGNIKSALS